MKLNAVTKQFFGSSCFRNDFPGWDDCLTGYGVAALLGLTPWETRLQLYKRLTGTKERRDVTWEMRRGMKYKESVFQVYEQNSPALVLRRNPFNEDRRFYVSSETMTGVGGVVDAFLINESTGLIAAGMSVRTSGLSMAGYWGNNPAPMNVAQNLLYMGLCGGMDWVLSVMLFRNDEDEKERIPFEVRNYWQSFDQKLFDVIYEKARSFWCDNCLAGVEPEEEDFSEITEMLNDYIRENVRLFRITPPVCA